jgi:RNA polymerase sigma-70 factor, ECF subfamily
MLLQTKEEKFIAVLKNHKKIVFKVCNFYCRNAEDRKDLAQEIIIQLWKSFHKYNDTYKISTWIYRIALNVSISFYRNKKRNEHIFYPGVLIDIDDNNSGTKNLEEGIQLLHSFIDKLDDLNKALMILYLDRNTYKEIAEILGITETNVATKINRIKQKLKLEFIK